MMARRPDWRAWQNVTCSCPARPPAPSASAGSASPPEPAAAKTCTGQAPGVGSGLARPPDLGCSLLRAPGRRGDADDLSAATPLSRPSGMSRLVMLSDATGVRVNAGVMPAARSLRCTRVATERVRTCPVGKYRRNTPSSVTLEDYFGAAARCQGLRAALSASGGHRRGGVWADGEEGGEPRGQQGLRAGRIAGRLEPYSLGGAR